MYDSGVVIIGAGPIGLTLALNVPSNPATTTVLVLKWIGPHKPRKLPVFIIVVGLRELNAAAVPSS
jgi:2-polyprenyl-6-methoxyphenol hydroxylase-like FAD-dependent oxidoreductase